MLKAVGKLVVMESAGVVTTTYSMHSNCKSLAPGAGLNIKSSFYTPDLRTIESIGTGSPIYIS